MSLKDRLREAAQQAQEGLAKGAQQAQEGLAKGQAKLEEIQRDRQSAGDELEALGQAYWVLQSGRGTPEQLQALLEAVRPAILASEVRLGPLPWPPTPAAHVDVTTMPPWGAPAAQAPTVAGPETVVAGPVGAPAAAPSSMPSAVHHEPPPD